MKVSIENNHLIASFNTQGAELVSLKNKSGREYIWEGNPAFWGKHSPVLFPIVGTLKDNQYQYKNKNYHLPRHGFARDYEFALVSKTESTAVFSLHSNTETEKIYPFDFEFQIHYELNDNFLSVRYKIINVSSVTMPFSIGGHPAFALPKPFENYQLEFEKNETLESFTLQNDLLYDTVKTINLNERLLPLTYALFENDALIFKRMESKTISILENSNPILKFHFDDFKNFGIWTKINAPFVCLEPWLGYSDTLDCSGNIEEKEGIQSVAAGAEFICTFKIEIVPPC